jgi:hypothetical protein
MQKSGKLPTDEDMMDATKENNTPSPSKQQSSNLINLQS